MSDDYKTVRVTPETYRRLHEVRDRLVKQSNEQLPETVQDIEGRSVSLGKTLSAAIEALAREIDLTDRLRTDQEDP